MRCPGCRHDNPADAFYCGRCGVALEHGPADASGTRTGLEAEHRQLTVMFCDLVDSTGLAQRLDPEELREVLGAYQDTCARIVARFEGHVAQYRGDGLLVYFSYPLAHEDDAERAVKAGLEIVGALDGLNPELERSAGVRLRVRVGIHTGRVVVGEVGEARGETVALGHSLNVAARLEGIADPDCVVMSAETLRLVRGLFVTEDLGAFQLKGIAEPVRAHRAIRPSGVRSRIDVASATGLTPLVGREQDLALLVDRWDRICEGSGQVVLVLGDAGIGKSRLMRALRDRIAEERHTWLECRGSPHHRNSAFHPVIELLRQALRFAARGSPDEQIAWLERAVDLAGMDRREFLRALVKLLSLPLPERYAGDDPSPDALRRVTLEGLGSWLLALARLQPTVMVVEDLHWTDPSSIELVETLIERVRQAPVLLLATSRPTFKVPWADHPHVARLELGALTRRQTVAMIEGVAGGATLPARAVDQVVRKTDGIPLFIEELTKSLLESGPSADPAIPATLRDSLMARLDRLGPVKELAQLAAVLGREFSHELLTAVSGAEPAWLDHGLEQLRSAELVYQRGTPPQASYIFKHAMIQETAYESLLKEARRALHARTARTLMQAFPERVEREPEEIARHCEGGGLLDEAIHHYRRAGERAAARSANEEAIGFLTRAKEILGTRAEGPERDRRELALQTALGACYGASRGWGTREAERACVRAIQLGERIGESAQLFPVLRGLVAYHTSRGDLGTTLTLGGRLLSLAERGEDASQRLLANHHLGIAHYFRGHPPVALEHFERALEQYDPSRHRTLSVVYQADPGVDVRIWMAWPQWMLGYPDRSLTTSREAIDMARAAAHPFSLGYALLWTSVVHLWRRERPAAQELAEQAIEIGAEQGYAMVQAGGRVAHALARMRPEAAEGAVVAAVGDFERALRDFASAGSEGAGRPHILGELAAALLGVGRDEGARTAVDAGLDYSRQTSQRYWDPELHRLRGELLLREPDGRQQAEQELRLALELSRKQKARMLELRATASLCRLDGGNGSQAALAAIYRSFDEGLDTPDLAEARTLLDLAP